MSRLTFSVVVPILGILGVWALTFLPVWPADLAHNRFEALVLGLGIVLFGIGVWLHRTATSALQRLGSLLGPFLYFGFWVWVLRTLEAKDGLLFSFKPTDYAAGLAPTLGLTIGFACSAAVKALHDRASDDPSSKS